MEKYILITYILFFYGMLNGVVIGVFSTIRFKSRFFMLKDYLWIAKMMFVGLFVFIYIFYKEVRK